MIKVVIADDEEKVCHLITRLINWEALDMEVAGVAHNGIEALKLIKEQNPYIVITDIRMPGYDGLEMIQKAKEINNRIEFIIISGYRHFEYAQNAIRYGVMDYLLKPIDENELRGVLEKLRMEYMQRTQQLTYEERVLLRLKNDEGKLRSTFLSGILYPINESYVTDDLEEVNGNYHYRFKPGCFQIISIKIDGIFGVYTESMEFMTEKIVAAAAIYLKEYCHDLELYFESSYSFGILNYEADKKNSIRKQLKLVLDNLLVQENIFENIKLTIGMGSVAKDLKDIRLSKKSAISAIEQRLIEGTGKLIDGERIIPSDIGNSDMFDTFNRKLNLALEHLNRDEVRDIILKLRSRLVNSNEVTGHEALQVAKEIGNVYQLFLKKNGIEESENFFQRLLLNINDFYSVGSLYTYLTQEVLKSLEQVIDNKMQADNRPIRVAKEYIKNHYSELITLDAVAQVAGFNTTYFSSLFKKETGQTFLEYLSSMRMDEAKRMLKETRDSVAVICENVGYSDVKYFTKSFIKYTGLKPNEYRKLYS